MARRRRGSLKREVLDDPIYHSKLVTKFINSLQKGGKKPTASRLFYKFMELLGEKVKDDTPLNSFKKALKNITPKLEVKSRRIGGATYQVPLEVREERKQTLAIRWMISYARARSEKSLSERLLGEVVDALNKQGSAYKKKEDTHKMADANKAFAHYRF